MEKQFLVIGLGSNIGDKNLNLLNAKFEMEKVLGPTIQESKIYETAAWGNIHQDDFLNQVIIFNTDKSLPELLKLLKNIELKLGRKPTIKWGPRSIDLDILFYGSKIYTSELLQVPHPQIEFREFVLLPLLEIMPEFIHPLHNLTINELFLKFKKEN